MCGCVTLLGSIDSMIYFSFFGDDGWFRDKQSLAPRTLRLESTLFVAELSRTVLGRACWSSDRKSEAVS